jgi:cytochrome c oxidase subunit 3
MAAASLPEHGLRLVPPPPVRTEPPISNSVLGMLLFVVAEAMLFAGLISAFTIARSAMPAELWPPPGQPRLPVASTAFNSALLLGSGVVLYYAWRRFQARPAAARAPMLVALLLGAGFVGLQGLEWASLIRDGMTLQTSTHGAFFYLIVGTHAAHAVGALAALAWQYSRLLRGKLLAEPFAAFGVFWAFVVLVWPVLYVLVYL